MGGSYEARESSAGPGRMQLKFFLSVTSDIAFKWEYTQRETVAKRSQSEVRWSFSRTCSANSSVQISRVGRTTQRDRCSPASAQENPAAGRIIIMLSSNRSSLALWTLVVAEIGGQRPKTRFTSSRFYSIVVAVGLSSEARTGRWVYSSGSHCLDRPPTISAEPSATFTGDPERERMGRTCHRQET